MSNSFTDYMIYYIFRQEFGKYKGLYLSKVRKQYIRSLPYNKRKLCSLCGEWIKDSKDLTIDHIIPESFTKKHGLYSLTYDTTNFRIAHEACNVERADNYLEDKDIPDKVKQMMLNIEKGLIQRH